MKVRNAGPSVAGGRTGSHEWEGGDTEMKSHRGVRAVESGPFGPWARGVAGRCSKCNSIYMENLTMGTLLSV